MFDGLREVDTAPGRALGARRHSEEAGEVVLKDVFFSGTAEDSSIEPAPDHGSEPLGEAEPDLSRRLLTLSRVRRVHFVRPAYEQASGLKDFGHGSPWAVGP
jgi:hypothetical protein